MARERTMQISRVLLRIALAAAFLSAIADRFGVWGKPGTPGVSWGDWNHFLKFVAYLNWFVPHALIPALGGLETAIEFGLAIALLIGIYPRIIAWSSAALLAAFALAMSIRLGVAATLGYGVFTSAAAALLLGACARGDAVRTTDGLQDPLTKDLSSDPEQTHRLSTP